MNADQPDACPPSSPRASGDQLPYAIGPQHHSVRPGGAWRTPLAIVVLGGMIAAAASGVLGGGPSRVVETRGGGIAATLVYDPIVRGGNWFETTVTVRAERPVTDLAVAVDEDLWRRMSIDTISPDAESAEALDGRYTYHFGPMKPGETFRLKLDGQIQAGMLRRQSGSIAILDDKTTLLALPPMTLTVLP